MAKKTEPFRLLGIDIAALADDLNLKHSAYAYVALIFIGVFELAVSILEGYYRAQNPSMAATMAMLAIALTVISFPLIAVSTFGFVKISLLWKSRFLAYSSIALLVMGVLLSVPVLVSEVLFVMSHSQNTLLDLANYVVTSLGSGVLAILFGVALWSSNKETLVRVTAVGNVLSGLLCLTVILSIVGMLANFPVMVLEACILWREGNRLQAGKATSP